MKDIEHSGKIIAIEGHVIDVEMIVSSACSSCKAKAACGMSESTQKCVTIVSEVPEAFSVGEEVLVVITEEMGLKAVVFAYIIPFVLLMGALIGLLQIGLGEAVAGLLSLGAVAVYYFGLYLMRSKIEKEIIFKLRKI